MAQKMKKVFMGHNTWPVRIGGELYGPGTVEVPEDVAAKLEKAVARISRGAVDVTAVDTPRPVTADQLTDYEVLAMARSRGLVPAPDEGGGLDESALRPPEPPPAEAPAEAPTVTPTVAPPKAPSTPKPVSAGDK